MVMTDAQLSELRPHVQRFVHEARARVPWLQAVGVGEKVTGGKRTGQDAIIFFVGNKLSEDVLEQSELFPRIARLPGTATEFVTDVVPTPAFKFVVTCSTVRPARGGDCIAPFGSPMVGTLGTVMTRRSDGRKFILSASHVILGVGGSLPLSQRISHPPANGVIGTVSRSVPWVLPPAFMAADAGLVEVATGDDVESIINDVGAITGSNVVSVGDTVSFRGVHGLKKGKVVWQESIVFVQSFWFANTFLIESDDGSAVAEEGDSGAIVLNDRSEAVGIVFATNGKLTACSHFSAVDHELGLSDYSF